MTTGVLALQGDFHAHELALSALGVTPKQVKTAGDLSKVSSIVLPGGESTALLRLMDEELRQALVSRITAGMPCLATCAGIILIAGEVENPPQLSLQLLDVTVERNAYGRQLDSFITQDLSWTPAGSALAKSALGVLPSAVEGVFIRAPKITRLGAGVQTVIEYNNEPVLVASNNILAATFHPELSSGKSPIHQLLLKLRSA